jgi:hypothetical protein
MATLISALVTNARTTLVEASAAYWSDAELLVYAIDGIKDMWRGIIDLQQDHFTTQDVALVSLAASSSTLTGVPADVFRVELIEPRVLTTSNAARNVSFEPRSLNHPDFTGARSLGAVDPAGRVIYYAVLGAGSPIAAPIIEVAPQINAALLLRFTYTASIGALTAASNNPIPGDADHAIQAWIIAHARAKEREDRSPDPEWLAIYASDKKNILTALTPRQTQEPDYAEALFESYWG